MCNLEDNETEGRTDQGPGRGKLGPLTDANSMYVHVRAPRGPAEAESKEADTRSLSGQPTARGG